MLLKFPIFNLLTCQLVDPFQKELSRPLLEALHHCGHSNFTRSKFAALLMVPRRGQTHGVEGPGCKGNVQTPSSA